MALSFISDPLLRFGALISEHSTASNVVVVLALLAVSAAYLTASGKHLPKWVPLEIGAASYLISSGGLGLFL
jgi:hypothetical protein